MINQKILGKFKKNVYLITLLSNYYATLSTENLENINFEGWGLTLVAYKKNCNGKYPGKAVAASGVVTVSPLPSYTRKTPSRETVFRKALKAAGHNFNLDYNKIHYMQEVSQAFRTDIKDCFWKTSWAVTNKEVEEVTKVMHLPFVLQYFNSKQKTFLFWIHLFYTHNYFDSWELEYLEKEIKMYWILW